MTSSARAFLRLTRPHFLAGGALLFWVGAQTAGITHAGRYALGQAMVTAVQATAHYANEYSDRDADTGVVHRTWFSGGSGVLPAGELAPRVALRAAGASTAVAVAAAAGLAPFSPAAAVLGVVALAVSWAYSMPPVRLLAGGWGEAAASVVVAGLVPAAGALTQSASIPVSLGEIVAILVPVHLAMMLAFELPDLGGDAAAGKRVLAVRLGRRGALGAIGGIGAATAAGALATGFLWTAGAVLAGTAAVVALAVLRRHHSLTAAAVAMLVLAALGAVI